MRALLGKLDPRTALRLGIWLLAGLLLVLAVRAATTHPDDNPAYDALAKAHTRRMVADSVALADANEKLIRHELVVGRQIVKYRTVRDSLVITDTVKVREFVERADSVVRSCTELVESCSAFRVRAESSLVSLRLDRDRWKLTAESQRPSGLRYAWDRVKLPLAFGLGLWAGSRVVR